MTKKEKISDVSSLIESGKITTLSNKLIILYNVENVKKT